MLFLENVVVRNGIKWIFIMYPAHSLKEKIWKRQMMGKTEMREFSHEML